MSNEKTWTWEGNPKKQFERRRLERCYQLDYKEQPMSYKSRPHREPYWNFWRAVFAGWLIRYPFQILKGIGTGVLFIIFTLIIVTGGFKNLDDSTDTGYNREVPARDRLVIQ